jgi:hypothetical protein
MQNHVTDTQLNSKTNFTIWNKKLDRIRQKKCKLTAIQMKYLRSNRRVN